MWNLFFQTYWAEEAQEILFDWEKKSHKPRNEILGLGIFTATDSMIVNMGCRETQDETAVTSVSSMHGDSEGPVNFS